MQEKLLALGQKKMISHLDALSLPEVKSLQNQISSFDFLALKKQQENFSQTFSLPFSPSIYLNSSKAKKDEKELGEAYLHEKGIAVCVLAGGQGSRFSLKNFSKGCLEVSLVQKKSLFQLLAEKLVAAKEKYKRPFYLALMLSPLNENHVIHFFQKHNYFGLEKENVFFFSQNLLPMLDEKGEWILQSNDRLALAPNGNGDLFYLMHTHGLLAQFEKKCIEHLSIFSIDNPLIDPLNPSLLGRHLKEKNEITLACIPRQSKTGLLVQSEKGCLAVLEYLYLEKEKIPEKVGFSNINHFFIDLSFAKKVSFFNQKLFYHKAWKAVQFFEKNKKDFSAKPVFGWKSEKFIFDNFLFASRIGTLLQNQEECYVPLKKKEDLFLVKQALWKKDQAILKNLFKTTWKKSFELSQEFHYPTSELIALCQKQKKIPFKKYLQKTDL